MLIKVEIEGARPILLHNPAGMATPTVGGKNAPIPLPAEEAKGYLYWLDDEQSSLALPSMMILRSFINGASGYKFGKQSAATVLAGGVEIDPLMISFNTKEYKLHTCRVVVGMGKGIMRTRPLIPAGYKLEFDMLVDDTCLNESHAPIMREIMETAGRRMGLGDFRPQKKGPYGKFNVTRWEVMHNGNGTANN
jgi:hypothetical protein